MVGAAEGGVGKYAFSRRRRRGLGDYACGVCQRRYEMRFQVPAPPLQDCPDVDDCIADPSEIGRVCTYGPICGTCAVYRVIETARGLLLGTCRIRTERGEFPCTAPICHSYH